MRIGIVIVLGWLGLFATRGMAEDGVSEGEILLGQSCALTGPAEQLGQGMRAGLSACFAEINAAGGVNGHHIRLISLDDGYEPQRAINNTRALIETQKVFALIGEVGTPTSLAVVPMAEAAGTPFFGPFTGAEFLRHPFKKHVVNVRASYYQEMERLAEYLVGRRGLTRIACFYQNDGYGQAGLRGIERALETRGLTLAATGHYERNSLAVKGALLELRKARPQAVVMVGAYAPCAKFIRLARQVGMDEAVYCNISFVGTEALCAELGTDGEGCVISQVVPYPWDTSVGPIAEYQAAMKQYQPDARMGFVSLEGYLVGRLFARVAERTEPPLSRERFLQTVSRVASFDLGGLVLEFGPEDHQGMDRVFLTVIEQGRVVPLKE